MKHRHHNSIDSTPGLQPVMVLFEFTDPAAALVCVAGTFNDWQPEAKELHSSGGGKWVKETPLKPGDYEYCFVVDGRWIPDPHAKETVANPFGGQNSILKVAPK